MQAGVKILVDPWLVDELTFAGQRWLYRGKKTHIPPTDPDEVAKGCDAIILSQVSCYTSCNNTQVYPLIPGSLLSNSWISVKAHSPAAKDTHTDFWSRLGAL